MTPLVTKHEILHESAQIYDPLGLLTPVTVRAKILLQSLWEQKVDWDEPLNQELTDTWLSISADLQEATTIVHPRPYYLLHCQPTTVTQLHTFTDASFSAYGAVVYLRQNNHDTLVMSRSRVTPIRPITLPKLELMAAVIGVRLANFVIFSVKPQFTNISTFLWSDSQIVLHWIHHLNLSTQSKPFIANHVQEIRDSFPVQYWTYVSTSDNPADLLTRGLSTQQLRTSQLWLHEPSWLQSDNQWPTWSPTNVLFLQTDDTTDTVPDFDPTTETNQPQSHGLHSIMDVSCYSQLTKLLSTTLYAMLLFQSTMSC